MATFLLVVGIVALAFALGALTAERQPRLFDRLSEDLFGETDEEHIP